MILVAELETWCIFSTSEGVLSDLRQNWGMDNVWQSISFLAFILYLFILSFLTRERIKEQDHFVSNTEC